MALLVGLFVGPILLFLILRPFAGEEYEWMKRRHPGKYPF